MVNIEQEKVVFLPFYGEFGWFLNSFIRFVHYYKAKEKVVCCHPGEEIYFPSANSFFYNWKDIFADSEKCGFRNTWPIDPAYKPTKEEKVLEQDLRALYPNHQIVRFEFAIPPELVQYFPIPIRPVKKYGISSDIVICARNRQTMGQFGDKGIRNYQRWDEIVSPLNKAGYTISIVGKEHSSYNFHEACIRSWEFEDNAAAIIELLSSSKLYIGTDTGPTHLAALLRTPMILFRNMSEKLSPNMLLRSVLPVCYENGVYAEIVEEGWDNPKEVVKKAMDYLEKG